MHSPIRRGIDGRRLADALRRIKLTLVHISGAYHFVRERPHGRLVVVPMYPGEILPLPIVRLILLHAAISERTAAELVFE
jgi:predicted RNA binding protein YcfA (HicA-like mRNA interferase family)